jgi:SagB-type dehydrogenase family enzyme
MSEEARRYHEFSKHSRERLVGGGMLDWLNEPAKVKSYPGMKEFKLPGPSPVATTIAEVIAGRCPKSSATPAIKEFATLLHLGYGVTGERGGYAFRAAPSAGALFPAEAYLCCGSSGDLPAGVYYYNALRGSLVETAEGDFLPSIAEALGSERPAAAYLVLTAIPWRSGWKYRQRAYRYCLLDAGHLAGNLLLIGTATGLAPRLATVFDGEAIGRLLGVDGISELPVALVELEPGGGDAAAGKGVAMPRQAEPLASRSEADELIAGIHRAESVGIELRHLVPERAEAPAGEGVELPVVGALEGRLDRLILERRSWRRGAKGSLKLEELAEYLATVTWAYPADWVPEGGASNALADLRLAVMDVKGLDAGIYRFDALGHRLFVLDTELDRDALEAACMGQGFVARANVFLVATLDFTRLSKPGAFRIACLDAGAVGQFAYLAAEALGAGCCGIGAFFDDELSRLFGLDGRERCALYGLTLAMR